MLLDLETTKNFLRVDFDEDDMLINILIDGAVETILNATGVVYDNTCKLAQIVALKIISINYNNRDSIIDKRSMIIPNFIENDLFRLKYMKPYLTNNKTLPTTKAVLSDE